LKTAALAIAGVGAIGASLGLNKLKGQKSDSKGQKGSKPEITEPKALAPIVQSAQPHDFPEIVSHGPKTESLELHPSVKTTPVTEPITKIEKRKEQLGLVFIPNDINRLYAGRRLLEPIQAKYHSGEVKPNPDRTITEQNFEKYLDRPKLEKLTRLYDSNQEINSFDLDIRSGVSSRGVMTEISNEFPYDPSNEQDQLSALDHLDTVEAIRFNPEILASEDKNTPKALENLKLAFKQVNIGKINALGFEYSLLQEVFKKRFPNDTNDALFKKSLDFFNKYSTSLKDEERFTDEDISIYKEFYTSIIRKEDEFSVAAEKLKSYYQEQIQAWEKGGKMDKIPEPDLSKFFSSDDIMIYPGYLGDNLRNELNRRFYYASKMDIDANQTLDPKELLAAASIEMSKITPKLEAILSDLKEGNAEDITYFDEFMKRVKGNGELSEKNIELPSFISYKPSRITSDYQNIVYDEVLKLLFEKYASMFPNNQDVLVPKIPEDLK
jgi:hypothetical protein